MAITDISIPLQYIKSGTLAQRPTSGQFNGQIYYATDTDASYVWNGTDWIETSVDLNNVYKLIGNNALNILDLTAKANLTAGINANFERDIYTDSNGYLNTIDTGNTTASFSTNKYINLDTETTENHNIGFISNSSSSRRGMQIEIKNNIYLKSFQKHPSDASTNWYLIGEGINLNGSFSGNNAVMPYPVFLEKNKTYMLMADANGSNVTHYSTIGTTAPSFPYEKTDLNWIAGVHEDFPTTAQAYYIIGLKYAKPSDKLIKTNKQDLELTPTKFMIIANEETTGTGSITYDISFDNGTNYQEDLESFTEYSVVDSGTELILKQNLNAGASEGTASAYNWGVLLW